MSEAAASVEGMDVLLIPGLWLDARSWGPIVDALTAAGHRPRPLTMPGVGDPDPGDIGLADWIDAVVAEIDTAAEPVVLVGHSGGGNVAWGAVDARPDRVARAVFVDTVPPAPGFGISEFPVEGGVMPFPGWDFFDAPETADLDAETRERTAALTGSVPARVPTDEIALSDPRRHHVPVTLLMGSIDEDALRAELAQWGPFADEFGAIADVEVVRIGSGHWPQFTQPERLAELVVAAVR